MTIKLDRHAYKDAIDKIVPSIEKYLGDDTIELEFRLGHIDDETGTFNTDVGKDTFETIKSDLDQSDIWESTDTIKMQDYFNGGLRMTVYDDGSAPVCIKKTKLSVMNFIFQGSTFDIRVSISKESPSPLFDVSKSTYKRIKERYSYVYKNWSYDLTKVGQGYEIELESLKYDPKAQTMHHFVHDALLKITDLVQMCESIDEDSKIIDA